MIRINYYLQTALLIIAACLLVVPIMVLYFQFLVGCIQMIISTILLVKKQTRTRLVKIHWLTSVVVLVAFGLLTKYNLLNESIYWVMLISIPWALAILFWYASRQLYKSQG